MRQMGECQNSKQLVFENLIQKAEKERKIQNLYIYGDARILIHEKFIKEKDINPILIFLNDWFQNSENQNASVSNEIKATTKFVS